MKNSILKKTGLMLIGSIILFGCSRTDSNQKQISETGANKISVTGNNVETTVKAPCDNKYYPVKNGLKRNYDNTVGGKTTQTMEYQTGASSFTEVTTLKDVNVKHVWNCTGDGLIAANYGSAAEMKNMDITPKHISGVTLPKEDEIKVGKTWTTVYEATGSSPLGAIETRVELDNKIVSIDDPVKTPGGNFQAVRVEVEIATDMKMGGRKIPVPKIKSTIWFAPEVGMIKSTGSLGGISNTMEYTGEN